MPTTRTPGITVDAHGQRTINKEYRGERIYIRLGSLAQEDAEGRLLVEIDRLESEIGRRRHARPLFSDCAMRFLLESKHKRTASHIAWHVRMLLLHVGHLEVRRVHDETPQPLVEARLARPARSSVPPWSTERSKSPARSCSVPRAPIATKRVVRG